MALSLDQFYELIHSHRKRAESENKLFNRWRSYYRSEYWAGQSAGTQDQLGGSFSEESTPVTEVNFAYAYVDTMIAAVVPPNPSVTVLPKKEELRESGKRREQLVNDLFGKANVVETLWEAATLAGVCGRSFVKSFWSERHERPDFAVIDPKFIWFDREAKKWEDVRYVMEATVKTEEEFKEIITDQAEKLQKKLEEVLAGESEAEKDIAEEILAEEDENSNVVALKVDVDTSEADDLRARLSRLQDISDKVTFNAYPKWLADDTMSGSYLSDSAKSVFKWVVVYEAYDLTGEGAFHMFLDGEREPIYSDELPYRHVKNPYQILTFNSNLEDASGLSDVKLIAPMLEELNEVESLRLWFMKTSIPVMTLNKGLCDNSADVKEAYENLNVGDLLEVEGRQSAPIDHIIGVMNTPSLSPDFSAVTARLESAIEQTVALSKYSRGQVGNTDVATEVALADAATRTRNGRRQKKVYEVVARMAECALFLWEEYLAENDLLHVRVDDISPYEDIDRKSLGMVGVSEVDWTESIHLYEYETVPYSATENNRLVQLQQIQEWLPVLSGNPALMPFVDIAKLMRRLLELLNIPETFMPPQPAPPGAAPGMPPGAPMGAGPMPPGQEPMIGNGAANMPTEGAPPLAGSPLSGGGGAATGVLQGMPKV